MINHVEQTFHLVLHLENFRSGGTNGTMIQHVLSIWGICQLPGEGLSFSLFSILRNKGDTLPYKTNHSSLQDCYDIHYLQQSEILQHLVVQLDSQAFLTFLTYSYTSENFMTTHP